MEPTTTKAGYRTTEFWLSLIAAAVGFAMASGLIETDSGWDKVVGLVAGVLTSLGYTASRTIAKG